MNKHLKHFLVSTFLVGSTCHAAPDLAATRDLLAKNACLGCHAIGSRLVGPGFKEVAAKYQGMEAARLAASIRAGGQGKWGALEMPTQKQLSEADSLTLAEWVLAGSPQP